MDNISKDHIERINFVRNEIPYEDRFKTNPKNYPLELKAHYDRIKNACPAKND